MSNKEKRSPCRNFSQLARAEQHRHWPVGRPVGPLWPQMGVSPAGPGAACSLLLYEVRMCRIKHTTRTYVSLFVTKAAPPELDPPGTGSSHCQQPPLAPSPA